MDLVVLKHHSPLTQVALILPHSIKLAHLSLRQSLVVDPDQLLLDPDQQEVLALVVDNLSVGDNLLDQDAPDWMPLQLKHWFLFVTLLLWIPVLLNSLKLRERNVKPLSA
jgi:hypothetical protein